MDILDPAFDPDRFFAELARADRRLLMLDYDGTLAPFVVDRDRAVPWPGVTELIDRLLAAGRCRTVVITGRGVDSLVALLGTGRRPEVWGSHGWERLLADGRYEPPSLDARAAAGLEEALDAAGKAGFRDRCETKPAGVALHWRGAPDETIERMQRDVEPAWRRIADLRGLCLRPFDGGIEIRPPGRDKGTAVSTLLAENRQAFACFLGDDLTDEDAFEAIRGRGTGILVSQTNRQTAAAARITPPDGLLAFLERWLRETEG